MAQAQSALDNLLQHLLNLQRRADGLQHAEQPFIILDLPAKAFSVVGHIVEVSLEITGYKVQERRTPAAAGPHCQYSVFSVQ
jgi:hypothetical protein